MAYIKTYYQIDSGMCMYLTIKRTITAKYTVYFWHPMAFHTHDAWSPRKKCFGPFFSQPSYHFIALPNFLNMSSEIPQHFGTKYWQSFLYFCPLITCLWCQMSLSAHTRRWIYVGSTLAHCLRRWTNVETTLIQSLVSAGLPINALLVCDIKADTDVDLMLVSCWASVADSGPTWNQHWINVPFRLRFFVHLKVALLTSKQLQTNKKYSH